MTAIPPKVEFGRNRCLKTVYSNSFHMDRMCSVVSLIAYHAHLCSRRGLDLTVIVHISPSRYSLYFLFFAVIIHPSEGL